MLSTHSHPALLLNADYRPIRVHPLKLVSWRKAVRGVYEGRYDLAGEYDRVVRSPGSEFRPGFEMRIPSVVALRRYERLDRPVAFTRLGLLIRDRYRCGFCGERFPATQLTFDHVVPRSKGGTTKWENILCACGPCNMRKGDKSPEKAGMRLRWKPYVPTRHQLNEIGMEFPPPLEALHPTWLPYLGIPDGGGAAARVGDGEGLGTVFPEGMTSRDYWNVELDE